MASLTSSAASVRAGPPPAPPSSPGLPVPPPPAPRTPPSVRAPCLSSAPWKPGVLGSAVLSDSERPWRGLVRYPERFFRKKWGKEGATGGARLEEVAIPPAEVECPVSLCLYRPG